MEEKKDHEYKLNTTKLLPTPKIWSQYSPKFSKILVKKKKKSKLIGWKNQRIYQEYVLRWEYSFNLSFHLETGN